MTSTVRRRTRKRRNAIGTRDRVAVHVVAVGTVVATVTAGCRPTGSPIADVVWTSALALVTVHAAATAPWWAVLAATFVATALATGGPAILLALTALAAIGMSIVASTGASAAWWRSAATAISLSALLRSDLEVFPRASAVVTAATVALVVVTGLSRRQRVIRRRARVASVALCGAVVVAAAGLVIAALLGRNASDAGYDALTSGLSSLGTGDTLAATSGLAEAAEHLDRASHHLDSWFAAPARLVPVLAQHRDALGAVAADAADASRSASEAVGLVDPTQLEMVGGAVDVEAVSFIADPLADLTGAIARIDATLGDDRSPWLLPLVTGRFEESLDTTRVVAQQVDTAAAVVDAVPAVFGADGPRRYLVAFTNPAESRGQSGVMGNWSELTAEDGTISMTASGRTSDLTRGLSENGPLVLDIGDDFIDRFARAGAADEPSGTVSPLFWSNVTMSAHMPSVGTAMAQMYQASTGRTVDGVVIVDPTGIASLLRITGPVGVSGIDGEIDAFTAQRFLTVEQYELAPGEREDVLAALTEATMDALTTQVIVDPVEAGDALGRAALEGHLLAWFQDPAAQSLAERLGIDGALPRHEGHDGLAITVDNAAGNKIDSFLDSHIEYRAVMDDDGVVTATLDVTLANDAPASGLPDYVIGNLVDLPRGTASVQIGVHTPLGFTAATLDGSPASLSSAQERGWNVFTAPVDIAPGTTTVLHLELTGRVVDGDYRLVVRPPLLPRQTRWRIEATRPDGHVLAGFLGVLEHRSIIDGSGIAPWRAAPVR